MDLGEALILAEGMLELSPDGKVSLTVGEGRVLSREAAQVLAEHLPEVAELLKFQPWDGKSFFGKRFSLDTETELISKDPAAPAPDLILAVAWNGEAGLFLTPDNIGDFLEAHQGSEVIMHGASFDIAVLRPYADLEEWVELGQVHDTYIRELLIQLALTGRSQEELKGKCTLAALAKHYMDRELDKTGTARTTFGNLKGKPLSEFPPGHLAYAAGDAVATFEVYMRQGRLKPKLRELARSCYGFVSDQHLDQAWFRYGFLGHDIWLKTSIVFSTMRRVGLGTDPARRDEMLKSLDQAIAEAQPLLEAGGIPIGAGSDKALQAYLKEKEQHWLEQGLLKSPLARTAGGAIAFDKDARKALAEVVDDPLLSAVARFKQAGKFRETYVKRFSKPRLHPSWNLGLVSGRASCNGDLAVQTLPKDGTGETGAYTVRQGVVPGDPTKVFLGADYAQLEVLALAHVLKQLGFGDELAQVIEQGLDVHIAVAHAAVGDRQGPVTAQERKAAKVIVFGLPGTLGRESLRRTAKQSYGLTMTEEDIDRVTAGYKQLNPGLEKHLKSGKGLGARLAEVFELPGGNAGWELYKIVAGKSGVPAEDQGDYWERLERIVDLAGFGAIKGKRMLELVRARQPDPELAKWVRIVADREPYLSSTGRIRNNAGFGASRNGVFQSVAADGALLSLWNLYRAGFVPVAFIHDEIIVEVPREGPNKQLMARLSQIMTDTMSEVLGGIPVKVEPFLRSSLSPRDALPVVDHEPLPGPDAFYTVPTAELELEPEPEPEVPAGTVLMTMTAAVPKQRKRKVDQVVSRRASKGSDGWPF